MSLTDRFAPAPVLRPMMNIGCLFDIPTGRYYLGKHGESILNGGVPHLTGVVGRGNTFKSAITFYMMLMCLNRYLVTKGLVYDTEMSATLARMHQLAARMENIAGLDLGEEGRLVMTDAVQYSGTEFFDLLKEELKERAEAKRVTTPFLDKEGKNIMIIPPELAAIDSLSMFAPDVVIKMQDKAGVGESDRNTEALRDSAAKTQMLSELPTLTSRGGGYMFMTGHMGDSIQMDAYTPNPKKLSFLKQNMKIKNVPERFTFLMNNLWFAMASAPLVNQTTKAPEFPRNTDDDLKGDTDLMFVSVMNLRGKSGPTGIPFDVIVSQSEGVLAHLSQFYYCKEMGRFGLGGNDRNYYMELLPDCAISRTTVRGKIDSNEKLRRAIEITSDMCQMSNYWHDLPEGLMCEPKQLYDDLKAKGYDWDVLLDTRGWWTFEEDKNQKKFLSTMDLLNMRAGTYHPYWMEKKQ